MIVYVEESLFDSPAQVLVNTVNTVGVMGKGIAKEFKRRYPEMAAQYKALCERGLFEIGKLWLYRASSPWVLNFPTKKHWREASRIEYIHNGLRKFVDTYRERGITSISFPMLGCGNGQLNWDDVRPVMEQYLSDLPIRVYIHDVQEIVTEAPQKRRSGRGKQLKMRQQVLRFDARKLPFSEFWSDLERLLERDRTYSTQNGSQFKAYLECNADSVSTGVVIESAGERRFIPKSDCLRDLWSRVCNTEYARPDEFPADLLQISDQIVALLGRLDYIKIVPLRVNYQSPRIHGIRVESMLWDEL